MIMAIIELTDMLRKLRNLCMVLFPNNNSK